MIDEIRVGSKVKIVVKHQFREPQLGIVLGTCKDGHWEVYVTDPEVITKKACVDPARGDQIFIITKRKDSV